MTAVAEFQKLVENVSSAELRARLLQLDDEEAALRTLIKAAERRERHESKPKKAGKGK